MNISGFLSAPRDLKLTRFYYFLLFGGSGSISPFLNLFYVQLGLTGTQVGWVTATVALVTLIAAPIWASKNDKWRNPRAVLQTFLIFTALGNLWLVPQVAFLSIVLVSLFRALFSSGITPLSDSLALSVTGGQRAGYGTIRVWGSFGWVVFVLGTGWLIQQFGLQITLIDACVLTLAAALSLFMIAPVNFSAQKLTDQAATQIRAVLQKLLKNPAMVAVGLMIIIVGVANSGVNQFEIVYMQALGASGGMIGIAGMIGAVVELPSMLWADRVATRRGAYGLLLLAMFMYVLLRGMVLLFPSVYTIMAERAIGGVAFSFYTVGVVRFAAEQIEPHETRTVLALYTVTLTNLISTIGSPLSGAAYDKFGGAHWLYLIAAAGYFASWLCLQRTRPQRHQKLSTVSDPQTM